MRLECLNQSFVQRVGYENSWYFALIGCCQGLNSADDNLVVNFVNSQLGQIIGFVQKLVNLRQQLQLGQIISKVRVLLYLPLKDVEIDQLAVALIADVVCFRVINLKTLNLFHLLFCKKKIKLLTEIKQTSRMRSEKSIFSSPMSTEFEFIAMSCDTLKFLLQQKHLLKTKLSSIWELFVYEVSFNPSSPTVFLRFCFQSFKK